jgi:benzodiazapine receptor
MIRKYSIELISSLSCLILGMLSGLSVNPSESDWYLNLIKPDFNPPSWVFGPVWTTLYLMMGFAFGMIIKNRDKNISLIIIFILQMICNLAWSPLFFYFQRIDLALVNILALLVFILMFLYFSRKDKIVMALFIPYFLWVSFATILNYNIYILNIL